MTPKPRPVVRIAPSPTGDPHVGTAYMALFNYLVARKGGGRFILRIEDTDQTRYDAQSERRILESLGWLGLAWDEGPDVGGPHGPYRQSERTAIYRDHAARLLESGAVYRCFCTEARLTDLRNAQRARKEPPGYDGFCRLLPSEDVAAKTKSGVPHVLRLKVPKDRTVAFHDQLRGDVRIEGRTIDDQVLLKSDGFPTYHLANVVDDHLMEVTEVIRAEEWIVSTPKHVLLYEAFGWEPPLWRHMPLLRNRDHSKISKRKNPTSLIWYRQQGFLPEALINFLGLMGYSHPEGREVMDLATMLSEFDASRISPSGPVFDLEKLAWLDGEHLRRLTPDELAKRLAAHFRYREESGVEAEPAEADLRAWAARSGGWASNRVGAFVKETVPLVQERIKTLQEYAALARCFFTEDVAAYDGKGLVPKGHGPSDTLDALSKVRERLQGVGDWTAAGVEDALRGLPDTLGWKNRDLFAPIRLAVTGAPVSPPLFETMFLVGRDRCLSRLSAALRALGG